TVPTVADLKARRLELARASLREAVIEGGLDPFRTIVEALADEFDVMDIAAAAVKLLESRDTEEEADIPPPAPRTERPRSDRGSGERGDSRGDRPTRPARERIEAPEGAPRTKRGAKPDWATARLWVGAGRKMKMRPGDLVGAIANEVGIDAGVIGAIQIADGYSTVEVPEEIAEDIINALRSTTIKGKRVVVRRDKAAK
ncbi:MAG TPA: DbpA RNA binding domain-containing protein, partial [Gemmatimonas sp.]|nr:DbpA RNA binding domain-containing protein [Gemmatimonas sp.]